MRIQGVRGAGASAWSGTALLLAAAAALAMTLLGGCAMSREDALRAKAERVETELLRERDRVSALAGGDPQRPARLEHLATLRATLSAANIGLGTVPHVVPEGQRDVAYDVLEEAYDTIRWNIPLGPGDAKKALPSGFAGGALRLER